MTTLEMWVLLSVDAGCFHACMEARFGTEGHHEASQALKDLLRDNYLVFVGNELMLTVEGTDALYQLSFVQ